MKTVSTLALVAAAALFAGGCQNAKSECKDGDKAACCTDAKAAKAGTTVNTMCVMNPKDHVSEGLTADFNGQKVGFCCAGCEKKWNALSDADKQAKLAKVTTTTK